ncbi:MAG: T9SS type A sorting domain-containing protein [Ferruginibacter sp.]
MKVNIYRNTALLKRMLPIIVAFCFSAVHSFAQPAINRIEYFIDSDPGYGLATNLSFAGTTDATGTISITLAPLASGVHMVGIRSRDVNGAWSLDNKWLFLKPFAVSAAVQPNITNVEYYVDNDPGYGNATPLSIIPAQDLAGFAININLVPLNEGVHIVGIRSKDANGAWSEDNRWLFLKPFSSSSNPQPNINYVEWYVDSDPGYGNATPISIIPAQDLTGFSINLNLLPLAQGVHIVGIRSKDANGAWSIDNRWIFLKPYNNGGAIVQPNINRVEWYVDNDPGYGNGTPISIVAGQDLAGLSINLNLATLTPGVHIVGIRSLDANGAWSLDNKWIFLKPYVVAGAQPNITAVEYFIDTDPGYGLATAVPFTVGTDISNLVFNADISTVPNGAHKLGIRTRDANGAWSLDNELDFTGGTATIPVHFLNFFVMAEKADAKLYWSTATESNSKNFVIQRSADGINFSDIGIVAAAGFSTSQKDYSFTDFAALLNNDKTIYYRLKQVDNDGRFILTEIRTLKGNRESNMKLLLNPVQDEAVLLYTAANNNQVKLRIADASGHSLIQYISFVSTGLNKIKINTSRLPNGTYWIELVHDGEHETLKMLKQ